LTIEDRNLCRDSFEVQLEDPSKLKIDTIIKQDLNCNDNAEIRFVVSEGTPPYLYSISGGTIYKKDSIFLIHKAGLFQLSVLDRNLCTEKDSISIGYKNLIRIKVEPQEKTIGLGEQVQLGFSVIEGDSSLIQRLRWSPSTGLSCSDCEAPVASPYITESYSLTIEYAGECEANDKLKIRVESKDELYIPSAFYPLSDKVENRTFKIYSNNILRANLSIYNRWGEKIYHTDVPHHIGWNGVYQSDVQASGIYFYYLDITYLDGRRIVKKGEVNLVR
jgi:gliding motility-associated-like protein